MSRNSDISGTPYRFGPFELDLPPGWTGTFEDGVHTIASDAHDTALQFSGFEREADVAMSDLYGMVPEGAADLSRFTLPTGLDGFGWVDLKDDARRMVICSGTVVLALTELTGEELSESDDDIIETIIGTLRLKKGAA